MAKNTISATMEDSALTPVKMEDRKSAYAVFVTLTGFVVSPTAFLLGTTLSTNLTLGKALFAIFIGNLVLGLFGTLSGLVGQSTGLSTAMNSRIVFGKYGAIIPSILIAFTLMAINGTLMGTAGATINALIPAVPQWLAMVIFAIAIAFTSIFGFKGLSWLSSVAVPALFVLGIVALVVINSTQGGIKAAFETIPAGTMTFGAAISAVMAVWITGVSVVPDIGRFAKKPAHIATASIGGWILGAFIFEGIATVCAVATGSGDFVSMFASLGLLLPAFVVFFLAMWTTAQNAIWSFALAFSSASEAANIKLPRAAWNIIGVCIILAFALLGFASKFGVLLNLISVFAPPIAGVLISHFFLLGYIKYYKGKSSVRIYGFRWQAFAAWIIGGVVAKIWTSGVPALQGLIVAAIAYWILGIATKMKEKETSESAGGSKQELA